MSDVPPDDAPLKLLTDVIPVAIFLVDPSGRVSAWTGSAEKLLGFSHTEAMSLRIESLFRPAFEKDAEAIRSFELSGRASHYREAGYAIKRDGTEFLAVCTLDRARSEHDELSGYACTIARL